MSSFCCGTITSAVPSQASVVWPPAVDAVRRSAAATAAKGAHTAGVTAVDSLSATAMPAIVTAEGRAAAVGPPVPDVELRSSTKDAAEPKAVAAALAAMWFVVAAANVSCTGSVAWKGPAGALDFEATAGVGVQHTGDMPAPNRKAAEGIRTWGKPQGVLGAEKGAEMEVKAGACAHGATAGAGSVVEGEVWDDGMAADLSEDSSRAGSRGDAGASASEGGPAGDAAS